MIPIPEHFQYSSSLINLLPGFPTPELCFLYSIKVISIYLCFSASKMLTSLVCCCPFFRSPSMWIYALFILSCHFSGVGKGKWVIVSRLINLPHLPSSLFTIYKLCVLPLLGRELFSPLRTVFCLDWGRMRQRVTKENTCPSSKKLHFIWLSQGG